MNCVYHAWAHYAEWLGVRPSELAYPLFHLMYRLGQNEGGMYGGCVPLAIRALNLTSGLRVARIQHHPFFNKATFVAGASTSGQRWMSQWSDFGDEGISIEPAIYLWIKGQHAIFAERRPTDKLVILAIQLERRERYVRANGTASAVSLRRAGVRSAAD